MRRRIIGSLMKQFLSALLVGQILELSCGSITAGTVVIYSVTSAQVVESPLLMRSKLSQSEFVIDAWLDVYIYDYLVKRNLQASAKAFQAEGKVSSDPVAIDAPGGFLFEWWSVFWDIFIARTNENHSDVASSYIETQHIKAREQQQLQQQQQHLASPQQRLHMQQLMLQRHVQQQQQQQQQQQSQRRDGPHILNGTSNGLVGGDSLMRQNPGTASAMATKMYEERLKVPLRESLEDVSIKQQFGENMGAMMDSSNPAMLKPAVASGQPSGQALHATSGAMSVSLPQVQSRNQQLGSIEDIKPEINQLLNARTAGPDGSLAGVPGSNQGGNNLTLKGWPLTINDQLRSGILPQKPFMQSPQAIHQLQMLTPQQQLLLHAQQNLTSPSSGDVDARRLRILMNNKNMVQSNSMGEGVQNIGSMQAPGLPPGDNDILLKKMAQMQQQQHSNIQQQQLMQEAISSQQSHSSGKPPQHQDKTGAMVAGSAAMMGSTSNSLRGNDQASKSQSGRKRKPTLSSSDPANSSGTANTQGPSPSSAPSTPSTHTPGDVISMPTMPQSGGSSKPMMVFNSDGAGPLASPSNQLWDDKADLLVEDGSLEDNVESFLRDDTDPRDTASRSMDISKGSTFSEVGSIRASSSRLVCCHFSSDGKLLATGGHDKKAMLWYTDTLKLKTTLEEHSMPITDVRFSPSMPRLATSSFDKTVRVWDADNPGYSLRTFTGHSASVMSLDFHPIKEDLICSCDGVGEIRYWSINNGNCAGFFKGGTMQVRFQPRLGRCLAAAAENVVSIFDVETQTFRQKLQGHVKTVNSVCWNASGDRLASVSDDLVRVWSLGSGNEYECIYQLNCSGNKYQSCVFHPTYQSLLVVGGYETLELWNMAENKAMTKTAHENMVASLAASHVTGLVASASHDAFVKLWK